MSINKMMNMTKIVQHVDKAIAGEIKGMQTPSSARKQNSSPKQVSGNKVTMEDRARNMSMYMTM